MKISKPYKNILRSTLLGSALLLATLVLVPQARTFADPTTGTPPATNNAQVAPPCSGPVVYTPKIDPITGEVTSTGRCRGQELDNQTDTAVTCKDASGAPAKCDLITEYANPFITFLAAIAGLVVVISIVAGGIQYASSGGDPQKVSAAKKRITNAVLAFVGFLLMYAFLQWIVPGGFLHG